MGWFRRLRNTLPGSRVEETFDEEARLRAVAELHEERRAGREGLATESL